MIPPLPQRDLRDLTRQRTNLVRERATVINRLQKVLEWANLKLASVVTDVTGVSARKMLKAIAQGETDTQTLAELAKGRLRRKLQELKQALFGQLRSHHRFLISNHLTHLDFLEEQMAVFDAQISEQIRAQTTSGQLEVTNALLSTESTEQNLSQLENLSQSWEQAVVLLDTIPGVGRQTAELLLAEIGMDMSRFKSEAHLALVG